MLELPFIHYAKSLDVSYHSRVTRTDMVHCLLGNRLLQAVVQVTENPECRNALALHLMNPGRYEGRHKRDSFTFHQQVGPEFTSVMLYHRGHLFLPSPRQTQFDLKYGLDFSDNTPVFWAKYPCHFDLKGERVRGVFDIEERLFCPMGLPAVIRQVRVQNRRGASPESARLFAFLTPNQAIFPEAHFLVDGQVAVAARFEGGDEFLALSSITRPVGHLVAEFPAPFSAAASGDLSNGGPSHDGDNYLRVHDEYTNYPRLPTTPHLGAAMALAFDLACVPPGASRDVQLAYVYGETEARVLSVVGEIRETGYDGLLQRSSEYWEHTNEVSFGDAAIDKLYLASRAGLPASVSETGRMNAGIWGFNAEWARDSALASVGATLTGQFALAREMLERVLSDLVRDDGLTRGEGQWYTPRRAQVDMGGQLIYALWTYWVYSRDSSIIRRNWQKIAAVAEFPLGPDHWLEDASMVHCERDYRERDGERHGIEDGFELSHQMWVSIGLCKAADMAEMIGASDRASAWKSRATRLKDAVLTDPKYRFIEDGHLMKRRTIAGEFQRRAICHPYVHKADGEGRIIKIYPRCLNRNGSLEPDASEAWPIAYGFVDADSELAHNTLTRMEDLWNMEWDFGGYALNNTDSEPTKIGAWTISFNIITQAAAEARQYDVVSRNLEWFLSTKDGRGYTWWEYRDADPDLQIDHGIVPCYIYGEPLKLLVHHLLGFRPGPQEVVIRPHLLPSMKEARARIRLGENHVDLRIHNAGGGCSKVLVDGEPWSDHDREQVVLPIPDADTKVELYLDGH